MEFMRFSFSRLIVDRAAISRRALLSCGLLAGLSAVFAACNFTCVLAADLPTNDASRAQQRDTFGVKPVQPSESQQTPPVVTTVAINPAGTQVATGGDDHAINLWNIDDGTLAHQLRTHTDWVRAVVFSPDGKWLASAGDDRKIHLWDAATGKLVRKFGKHDAAIYALQFDPSSKTLAVAGFENIVRLYNAETGELIRTLDC
jgi:WD40 repeat protein